MSKHLRIWLFVLLGTLLTSTTLLAEGVITMTTSKRVGETISLIIEANGDVTIDGVKESAQTDGHGKHYTLTSQTVTIRGDVTTLYCSNNQLTRLDVSGCTALTTLSCGSNQLTSLDASGCTALTEVYCHDNPLTSINLSECQSLKEFSWINGQLTSLDVSSCTSLTELNCSTTNETKGFLTNLDVSGCTALTTLSCGSNQLTSLDVSSCTALTELYCSNNQLTSLDVSKNTSLTTLYCKGNQLTSLDVSGCIALTTLYCGENQLTSLDISGCSALTTLDCGKNQLTSLDVSGCTALTTLYCGENQLTSLNVSGCTALTSLNCGGNQLTSLDISGCNALTWLYCDKNQLTSLDISGCTALTTLSCESNQLTSLDLSGRTALTSLDCVGNQLTSLDLSGCIALTWLDCSGNQLISLDLSGCTALTSLRCYDNPLTSINLSGCQSLKEFSWFYNNGKLTSLNVSSCTALTQLQCWGNQLTNLDVSGCTSLTKLNCGGNQLTSLDVSSCTALTELYCYRNQLTRLNVLGCTALTELSCESNRLTSLNVSGCTALTKLSCYNNQLTSLDVSVCTALTELNCSGNQLTSLDLSNHNALTTLDCSKNLLRKIELSDCTSIRFLTCHVNQIKVSEMANLVNSLPDLQGKGVGLFNVFYDGSGEGNVCLATHVATAKAKSWKTQFTRDQYGDTWYDYTGADNPIFTVTSSSTSGGAISFTGADNLNAVPYGTELTVVVTPADGYKLTKLTANGQDILETKCFKVTENTRVEATFTLQAYNVTPIKVGEGTFYISGADNLDAVTPGTELTITADPAEGYELTKLTANDKNVLDTKKVVVNEDMTIRAIFSKKTFKVSLEPRGKGTIKAVGADDLNAVPYGTELTIVATPDEGSELTSLIAGGINITETKKVTIKKETTIEAVFTTHSFAVTLTKEGEGMVTATGADDLDAVAYGTELTINATPAAGYELSALTANGTDILASKKVTVKEAVEVKATFEKKNFAVTLTHDGEGDLDAAGSDNLKSVPYGTKLMVTATPAAGYELTALTANGTDILATKSFVVKGDTEVKATFAKKSFAVSLTKEGEGTISATGADNLDAVAYGTELTIVATPAKGYELVSITANSTDITATKKIVVTDNLTVKATFEKKNFAVTFDKEGEGTISAPGADDLNAVAYGTELTINATPAAGYELTALTANGTDILATKKIVVTDNLTVKATFEKKTFAVTLTSNEPGEITIVEPVNLKAVPYGTTLTVKATGKNAQCVLTELTANGEDILATKSFVVTGPTEVKATFVDHTGVEMTVTQQTQLYPNPATDYVIVEGVASASEVTLHSMTGERLYAGRADDRGTLQIDLTPYADGVYLVCVAGETYRVVVRH